MEWVTRQQLDVTRSATAWVIGRFIDPGATFRFVESGCVAAVARTAGGMGFGAPGTRYPRTDARGRSPLRALVEDYRPHDPAFQALARLVESAADPKARGPCAESPGLLAIARGSSLVSGDEEIVERSAFLYDALHASRRASPPADTRAARDALALAWFWLR